MTRLIACVLAMCIALAVTTTTTDACAVGNAGPNCSPCPISSYSLAGDTHCTRCPIGQTCPIASVSIAACYPISIPPTPTGTNFSLGATFSGVLVPGTYTVGTASVANLPVQLDCQSVTTSAFLFVIGGALAVNANVTTINGVCNVRWQVDGAVNVNIDVTLFGDVTATGAINIGRDGEIIGIVTPASALVTIPLTATFSGTLTPGTYTISAAAATSGNVKLNCQQQSTTSFVFIIGGALSLNHNVTRVAPYTCNVRWQVDGAVTIGPGLIVDGDIAATGAITLLAGSRLNGIPVTAGALTIGTGASFGSGVNLASATPVGFVSSVFRASRTSVLPSVFGGPLTAGTYTIPSKATVNLDVTLDCQGRSDAVFNFIIGGALSFKANAQLTNGNGKVHWGVNGLASIAAGFHVDGDLEATGAITLATGAQLNGCARAGGALTLGTGASVLCSSTLNLSPVRCPVGNAAPGCLPCPIGSYSLANDNRCTPCPVGQTSPLASQSAAACYPIGTIGGGAVIPMPATIPSVLTAGTYTIGAAATVSSAVQLDCQSQTNAVFRFVIGAALSLQADVVLANGFGVVHWEVTGAVSIAANVTIDGDLDATGAISLGPLAIITGYARTQGKLTLGLGAKVGSSLNAPAAIVNAGGILPGVFPSVLLPGAYSSGAATAVSVPVQLDCQGDQNAVFSFVIGGALSINANVLLTNGNGQVQWTVDGAVSIGFNVTADGDIDATGAITVNGHLNGCARCVGAFTLGVGGSVSCAEVLSGTVSQDLRRSLQFAASSELEVGCPVGNAAPGCMPCPVGSYSLAADTHCTMCPTGQTCPVASVSFDACHPIASTLSLGLDAIPLPATFSGVLVPGSYSAAAATAVNLPAYLDCQRQTNAVFRFVIVGALSFNANVTRINGTCSVLWEVDGAVSLASLVFVDGDIAATGAISLGAGAVLSGVARAAGSLIIGVNATAGSGAATASPSVSQSFALGAVFSGSLIPGTYTIGAASVATAPVLLDCQGSQSAVFSFVIGGALTLNANVLLVNGNGKVHWAVDGAVYIAKNVSIDGDIDAVGAINLLDGAHLSGCARTAGALNLGQGATTMCAAALPVALQQSLRVILAATYVIPLAVGCAVGNAGPGCTPCPVGSYSLAGATHCTKCPAGQTCPIASVGADACHPIASVAALSGGSIPLNATLTGVLFPGTYVIGAAMAINAPTFLDCKGQLNAGFLFVIGGALSINANVTRLHGLCNVHWEVDGAVTIASGTFADGDIDATGAISIMSGAHLSGYAHAVGALTVGASAVVGRSSSSLLMSETLALSPTFGGILTPATYAIPAAAAASLDVLLDCQGRSDAVFNFIIGGALSFNANVRLTNGNGKVHWGVNGAASIAVGFHVDGDLEATGAITLATGAQLNGCARAGGALNLGTGASVLCADYLSAFLAGKLASTINGTAFGSSGMPAASTCSSSGYSGADMAAVGFVGLAIILILLGVIAGLLWRSHHLKPQPLHDTNAVAMGTV